MDVKYFILLREKKFVFYLRHRRTAIVCGYNKIKQSYPFYILSRYIVLLFFFPYGTFDRSISSVYHDVYAEERIEIMKKK